MGALDVRVLILASLTRYPRPPTQSAARTDRSTSESSELFIVAGYGSEFLYCQLVKEVLQSPQRTLGTFARSREP